MPIVFRCDDIGVGSNPDYLRIEQRLFELFFELDLPLLIGVVPMMSVDFFDPRNRQYRSLADDEPRMAMIRSGVGHGFQIALHGLNHQVVEEGTKSEFVGRSERDQAVIIEEGLGHLRTWFPDADVKVLIPPWNTFDAATVAAAADCGLTHVSAGDSSPTVDRDGVTLSSSIPIEAFFGLLEFHHFDDLARRIGDGHLVVTFHAYQFLESHPGYAMSLDEFGRHLQGMKATGARITALDPTVRARQFKPKAGWLWNLRVAVMLKSSRLGRLSLLDLARSVSRRIGVAPARLMVDAGALALIWLPLVRRLNRGF